MRIGTTYLAVITPQNKKLQKEILRRTKKWNKKFKYGTPDPRLRWDIDYAILDFHNETNRNEKVLVFDKLETFYIVKFFRKISFDDKNDTITLSEINIESIQEAIKSIINEEPYAKKLQTNLSYIEKWIEEHSGQTMYGYSIDE